ncbi:MAG: NYN domain-containing protein [bacterium]|nr:NYN domain-containing protein [bacterium]
MVTEKKQQNNYAFIDSQNLNLGIQKMGWGLDYRKFRVYLEEKYHVTKAFLFIGFVLLNQGLYDRLQECGFLLVFKPTIPDADGKIKGNVDADLVLKAVLECEHYDKAVVVSSDGDFYSLVKYLYEQRKLETVLSPDKRHCSSLLKQTAKERIRFMENLREKLEYKKGQQEDKKKKHRQRTKP